MSSLGSRIERKIKISRGEPLTPEEQAAEDQEKAEEAAKNAPKPTPSPKPEDNLANKVSKGAAAQAGKKVEDDELQKGTWYRIKNLFK